VYKTSSVAPRHCGETVKRKTVDRGPEDIFEDKHNQHMSILKERHCANYGAAATATMMKTFLLKLIFYFKKGLLAFRASFPCFYLD
jgi:hypothetical protein